MKFPYISSAPVVAEVLSEMKEFIRTTNYNEEDCYLFAIDAVRQVQGHVYDTDVAYLTIEKYGGRLPKDFYLVNNIWICQSGRGYSNTVVRPSPLPAEAQFIKTSLIYPADIASIRYCNRDCRNPVVNKDSNGYTLKIPPGIIRTGFPSGTICLDYMKLPMENGILLMPDEINCILMTKNYIKMMLMYERYMLGEISENVFKTVKNDYETFLTLAQNQQKYLDPAQAQVKAVEQDQRYRQFRYH